MDLDDAGISVKFVLQDRMPVITVPNELDHGTLNRQLPPRVAGPELDLEASPPASTTFASGGATAPMA